MLAPLRIRGDISSVVEVSRGSTSDHYLGRLVKLIPAEVICLYTAGQSFVPPNAVVALTVWAVFCLACVLLVRALGTSDKSSGIPTDWTHVIFSAMSFIIWLYAQGGPFVGLGLHIPYVGALLVLGWTFVIPVVYKGPVYKRPSR